MINIFTPPSTDQSIYYLGQIFGYVGNILPATEASMVLGTMFKVFNTTVLTVGALIVLYVTVVGVMKTAHEGEFMGRNWNNIWIPIRMVLGIAALVPSPSGYCAIQMVVMWIIIQGVGAADKVWDAVLSYTDLLGSPLSTITIPSVDINNNFQTLFQGLVCQATAKINSPMNKDASGGYYCYVDSGSQFCQMSDSQLLNISSKAVNSQIFTMPMPVSAPSSSGQSAMTIQMATVYPLGPNGACGTLTYCDPTTACQNTTNVSSQIACNACTSQQQALQASVNVLGGVASAFAAADYRFREFASSPAPATDPGIISFCQANNLKGPQCCIPLVSSKVVANLLPTACNFPNDITPSDASGTNAPTTTIQQLYWPYMIKQSLQGETDFIGTITNNYVSVLNTAVENTISQQPANGSFKNTALQDAQTYGWIFAGAYYYYLAKLNNKNIQAAMPLFTVTPNDPKAGQNNILNNLRNNYEAAGNLLNTPGANLNGATSSSATFSMNLPSQLSGLNKIGNGMGNATNNVMNAFQKMVTGAGAGQKAVNPLAQLQTLGEIILIVGQVLLALVIAVIPLLTLLGSIAPFAIGNGIITGVGQAIQAFAIILAPIGALFLGALFVFGALLAIYTPLIPYIIFTLGAITWLILIIEAMVAAPLVALGILMPSGHHEILGKADAALMLIFGIFLRPTLMIFGMIAALLMSSVVITMINAGFSSVMGSVYSSPGPVEILIFLGVYVGLVLAALNKCFALIHMVPDRALRWIGGGGEEAGGMAGEGLAEAKGRSQAVAGQIPSTGKEVGGKMKERAGVEGEKLKQRAEQSAAERGANIEAGGGKEGGAGGGKGGGG